MRALLFYILFGLLMLSSISESKAQEDPDYFKLQEWLHSKQRELDIKFEYLNRVKTPSTWDDAPAIKLLDYSYFETNSDIERILLHRIRIKIQDEFYVKKLSNSLESHLDEVLEIKVFHKDGSFKKYTSEDAVNDKVTLTLSDKNRSSAIIKRRFSLSGLGVGDIIEIDHVIKENLKEKWKEANFKSEFYILKLEDHIPIVARQIDFKLQKPFLLNWRSISGAPNIQLKSENEEFSNYSFLDTFCNAKRNSAFDPGMLEGRRVKFAIVLPEEGKYGLDLHSRVNFDNPTDAQDICDVASKIYSNYKVSDSEFFLYFERLYQYGNEYDLTSIDKLFLEEYKKYYLIYEGGREYDHMHFVSMFSRVLRKYNVPFKFQVCLPRELGQIEEDIVSVRELHWSIVLEDKTIYSSFDYLDHKNEISIDYYNQKSLVIVPGKSRSKIVSREEMGAYSNGKLNYEIENVHWKIYPDKSNWVSRKRELEGFISQNDKDIFPSVVYLDQLINDLYYLKESPKIYQSYSENPELEEIKEDCKISYETTGIWENQLLANYNSQSLKQSGVQFNGYANLDYSTYSPTSEETQIEITDEIEVVDLFKSINATNSMVFLDKLLPALDQEGWQDSVRHSGIYLGSNQEYHLSFKIELKEGRYSIIHHIKDTYFNNSIGQIKLSVGTQSYTHTSRVKTNIFNATKPKTNSMFNRNTNVKMDILTKPIEIIKQPTNDSLVMESVESLLVDVTNELNIDLTIKLNSDYFPASSWSDLQDFMLFYSKLKSLNLIVTKQ